MAFVSSHESTHKVIYEMLVKFKDWTSSFLVTDDRFNYTPSAAEMDTRTMTLSRPLRTREVIGSSGRNAYLNATLLCRHIATSRAQNAQGVEALILKGGAELLVDIKSYEGKDEQLIRNAAVATRLISEALCSPGPFNKNRWQDFFGCWESALAQCARLSELPIVDLFRLLEPLKAISEAWEEAFLNESRLMRVFELDAPFIAMAEAAAIDTKVLMTIGTSVRDCLELRRGVQLSETDEHRLDSFSDELKAIVALAQELKVFVESMHQASQL